MSLTFPYQRGDGKLPDTGLSIWVGGTEAEGEIRNRDLREYPPAIEVRKYLGVLAIERVLTYNGLLEPRAADGVFRWRTQRAVKAFQREEGLEPDGVVGPKTAMALFFHLVDETEKELEIPNHYLFGLLHKESTFDPGVIGSVDSLDRGLAQINRRAHGTGTPDNIADELAFDPFFSIPYAGERMTMAHERYMDHPKRAWKGAILQHNTPRGALHYVMHGEYAETAHRLYVEDVIARAQSVPHDGSTWALP